MFYEKFYTRYSFSFIFFNAIWVFDVNDVFKKPKWSLIFTYHLSANIINIVLAELTPFMVAVIDFKRGIVKEKYNYYQVIWGDVDTAGITTRFRESSYDACFECIAEKQDVLSTKPSISQVKALFLDSTYIVFILLLK